MLIINILQTDKYKKMSLLVYIVSSDVYPNHPRYMTFSSSNIYNPSSQRNNHSQKEICKKNSNRRFK